MLNLNLQFARMKTVFLVLLSLLFAVFAEERKAPDSDGEAGRWRAVAVAGKAPDGVMLTRANGKLFCSMYPADAKMWVPTDIQEATAQDVHFMIFSITSKKKVAYHLHLETPLAGDSVTGTLKLKDGTGTPQKVVLVREK
jgi:hypothetical protein